jgi:hypothetical protein
MRLVPFLALAERAKGPFSEYLDRMQELACPEGFVQ